VKDVSGLKVLDFGCSNWRNSSYLEELGAASVRVDALASTRPEVVAYPTLLPFRDKAFDIVLFTHIFMFLEDKGEWKTAADELMRVSRGFIVVETYAVKHPQALKYTPEEVVQLFNAPVRKNVRRDLQVFIFQSQVRSRP